MKMEVTISFLCEVDGALDTLIAAEHCDSLRHGFVCSRNSAMRPKWECKTHIKNHNRAPPQTTVVKHNLKAIDQNPQSLT